MKIDAAIEFVKGNDGLSGWLMALALIMVSVRQKRTNHEMAKISLALGTHEKELEDNTDAIKELNRLKQLHLDRNRHANNGTL